MAKIVGYLSDGSMIQKDYDYGCNRGEHDVYLYRITHTNEDGKVIELTQRQVAERAEELGVKSVPILWEGEFEYWKYSNGRDLAVGASLTGEEILERIRKAYVDRQCSLCTKHVPAEGICITVEGLRPKTSKFKSSAFLQYETKQLDSGEANIEDGQ